MASGVSVAPALAPVPCLPCKYFPAAQQGLQLFAGSNTLTLDDVLASEKASGKQKSNTTSDVGAAASDGASSDEADSADEASSDSDAKSNGSLKR